MTGSTPFGRIEHNFAIDSHYEFSLKRLGGEKLIKQKYPELYKILVYTREKAHKAAALPKSVPVLDDDYTYGLTDSMKLRTVNFHRDTTLDSASSIELIKPSPAISIVCEVIDVTYGKTVDGFSVFDNDTGILNHSIIRQASELLRKNSYDFRVSSTMTKIDHDDEGKPVFTSVTESSEKYSILNAKSIVKNITVTDPMPVKHTDPKKAPEKTVIFYNNRTGPECDYYYNNVRADQHTVDIYIPFKGSVEFDSYFKPLYVDIEHPGFMLQIETEKNGVAQFNTNHMKEVIWSFPNESTLSWEFPENWYDALQRNNFAGATDVGFYCRLPVILDKLPTPINVIISSYDNEHKDSSFKKIYPLEIMWGCFAKDTRIKMADGSWKPIQDIEEHDIVKTENGSAAVQEVISGTEREMMVIGTSRGNRIMVTKDHPMLTESGWKTADELNAADILIMEYGKDTIEELYPKEYNDKIFSIRIDTQEAIIAEGFYTGDFSRQNMPKDKVDKIKATPKEGFQQEYADLIASINKKMEESRG